MFHFLKNILAILCARAVVSQKWSWLFYLLSVISIFCFILYDRNLRLIRHALNKACFLIPNAPMIYAYVLQGEPEAVMLSVLITAWVVELFVNPRGGAPGARARQVSRPPSAPPTRILRLPRHYRDVVLVFHPAHSA